MSQIDDLRLVRAAAFDALKTAAGSAMTSFSAGGVNYSFESRDELLNFYNRLSNQISALSGAPLRTIERTL